MQSDSDLIPDRDYLSISDPPQPAFWIREIRLLDRLESGEAAEIRRIPLQLGLNIVWAKPSDPDEPNPENRGRGHDVGKTTFCRLIRHLLGESRYGTETTRKALSLCENLDHPWVVGEVVVSGETWTVGRPLYSGGHPFAVRAKAIDDALQVTPGDRLKHEEFVAHLQSEVLNSLPVHSFDTKGQRPIRWLHLLQWLARDQEAHLANPFKWRDTSSHSESPELTSPDSRFLVRSVLGVTGTDERKIIAKRDALNEEKDEHTADIRFHERRVSEALERARTQLPDGDKLPDIAEELFVDQVVRHADYLVQARRLALEIQIDEIELETGERALEIAIGQAAVIREQHDAEQRALKETEDQWQRYEARDNPATLPELEQILADLPPDRHHCEVPSTVAVFKCPILREHRKKNGEPEPEPQGIEEQVVQLRGEVERKLERSRENLRILAKRLEAATTHESECRKDRDAKRKVMDGLNNDLAKLTPEVVGWQLRAEDAKESFDRLEAFRAQITEIDRLTEDLKIQQDAAQKETRTRMLEIGKIFRSLSQELKGKSVDAELKFTRDETSARIGSGGGAYNALSALVFDYTALLARLHNIGHHPGFLLHDSPRESDMEPSLYRSLFRLLKRFADSAPDSFQYIVTTTEEPPSELIERYVVAILDGSTEGGLLFGTRF
jgi:archaellum component FlaC